MTRDREPRSSDHIASDEVTNKVVYEGPGPTTIPPAPEDRRIGYLVKAEGNPPTPQAEILRRASEQVIAAATLDHVDLSAL